MFNLLETNDLRTQIKPPRREPDVVANRKSRKWSRKQLIVRFLWETFGAPLFYIMPRQIWWFRNALLRLFGAKIGKQVRIHPTARVAVPYNIVIGDRVGIGDRAILYSLGQVVIGDDVTISQYAHLCAGTHDHRKSDLPLIKAPITIEKGAWICADAFVGPNVTVGRMAVVGARSVVVRDVAEFQVVVGNPARVSSNRSTQ